MEKKLDAILAILQEHSQLLRALEHRTEVTNSAVKAIKEEIHYIKGDITGMKDGIAGLKKDLMKEDQLALSTRIDGNHAEVKEKLNDLDEKMDYVLLQVARHEAKLLAKKKLS